MIMANSGNYLRDKQIASIIQMLNLNETLESTQKAPKEPIWKILIYDRIGMDILTPLFTVQELRQNGITLHIPLHSPDRNTVASTIPDVPAIYFALPSEDNVDRISRDIQSNLYGNYLLNFLRPIPRSMIEDIASAVLMSGDTKCVSKVYDQYVDFVCLEDGLFTLATGASQQDFYALNRPSITDTEMNSLIDNIVDSLFSVLVTYGQVPVIRTPKGNAAELIGEKLDKKIKDNLRDPRSSLFAGTGSEKFSYQTSSSRPLLVIYDRTMDLATPLAHPWTYQALTHDVLENNQNQIKFNDESPEASNLPSKRKTKSYSLDSRRDTFWKIHRGSPFPTVAEAIQTELEDYRKSEDEVKRLKETVGLMDDGSNNLMDMDLSDNTAKLSSAIKDLPQLIERKRVLDAHTSIATAILSQIKTRSLDTYYEIETKLITKSESVSINNILLDPKMGSFEDKLRLYLVYYLSNKASVSDTEMEQLVQSLVASDENETNRELLTAVDFVKKWISYSKMVTTNTPTTSLPSRGQSSMLTKFVTGSSFLMEGVRNLVYKRQDLPLTKTTLELMEGTNRETEENYRYFDPKQLKPQSTKPTNPLVYNDCIVFVVGGGNYIEYQNLVDCFSQRKDGGGGVGTSGGFSTGKRITYGASCLYNGGEFLGQLARLGREMK